MKKLIPFFIVILFSCTKEECITCEKYTVNNAEEVGKRYHGEQFNLNEYKYDGREKEYLYCATDAEREMWMNENGVIVDSGLIAPDDDIHAYVKMKVECYKEE